MKHHPKSSIEAFNREKNNFKKRQEKRQRILDDGKNNKLQKYRK